MKIIIGSTPLNSDYTNCMVVDIDGWYGDMDEKLRETEEFRLDDPALECYLVMCTALDKGLFETRNQMEQFLKEKGYDPDLICIPTDCLSHEMLGDPDSIDVFYYNDKGQKFSVDYEL